MMCEDLQSVLQNQVHISCIDLHPASATPACLLQAPSAYLPTDVQDIAKEHIEAKKKQGVEQPVKGIVHEPGKALPKVIRFDLI